VRPPFGLNATSFSIWRVVLFFAASYQKLSGIKWDSFTKPGCDEVIVEDIRDIQVGHEVEMPVRRHYLILKSIFEPFHVTDYDLFSYPQSSRAAHRSVL